MPTPIWTKEEKEFLICSYKEGKNLDFVASKLPYTRQQITAKAAALKLGKSRSWSEEEKLLLVAIAESMPIEKLTKAYNTRAETKGFKSRTESSISGMLKKLNLSRSPQLGCYAIAPLASVLGVSETPVRRWVKEGLLKATRQGESDRAHYVIYQRHFVRFALNYPGEIAKLNLDESALLWLLSEIASAHQMKSVLKFKEDAYTA